MASPTPTVPISSDSTSVMDSLRPTNRDKAAAAIHPAVPPPAITTWSTFCSLESVITVLGDSLILREVVAQDSH